MNHRPFMLMWQTGISGCQLVAMSCVGGYSSAYEQFALKNHVFENV